MEDIDCFGVILGKYLLEDEVSVIASYTHRIKKTNLLAGLISTITHEKAIAVFNSLPKDIQNSLLPYLSRDDISVFLHSPKEEELYWRTKRMLQYNEDAFECLLKYNPCGALPIFLNTDAPDAKLFEVIKAIISSGYVSDPNLLHVVIRHMNSYYSDEWGALCLELFETKGAYEINRYYPSCIGVYLFRHPEIIIERLKQSKDAFSFFYAYYTLPDEAFTDRLSFSVWMRYLYQNVADKPFLMTIIGAILGRSGVGSDGFFPHDFIRSELEKYSDNRLTIDVAIGRMNNSGCRTVNDGSKEKQKEDIYRRHARTLELDYPQTAYVLNMIADNYQHASRRDRLYAESFPV